MDMAIQFTAERRVLLKDVELELELGENRELLGVLLKLSAALICHSDYVLEKSSLIYYSCVRRWRSHHHTRNSLFRRFAI